MPPSPTVRVLDPYVPRFAPWATNITSISRTYSRLSTNANATQIIAAAIAPKTMKGTTDINDERVSLNKTASSERSDNNSHNAAIANIVKAVICI